MYDYEARRERRREFVRRNWFWFVPLGLVGAGALFVGLGFLVPWLWRMTLVDIFGIKPISFWQAWGLMLLSQILFKAHMGPTLRTRDRWRGGRDGGGPHDAGPERASNHI